VIDVAGQAGHSPETCLRYYAHLFAEFDPGERVSAEELIRKARLDAGGRSEDAARERRFGSTPTKPTGGLEPPTPSLRVKCSTS
jgi:hypothetical protein